MRPSLILRSLTREWLPLSLALALLALGALVFVFTRPTLLTVATGSLEQPEGRLIAAYAEVLDQQNASIRLRLVPTHDLRSSAEALQRKAVDLAVVRSDVLLPVNGLSVAILREEALIIAVPAAGKIEDVGGLEKKRIGLVVRHEADPAFVESVLADYDLKPPAVTVTPLQESEIAGAISGKKVDAVGFLAAPTSTAAEQLIRAVDKATGGKTRLVPLGRVQTLVERNPTLTAMEIKEGALISRPKLPDGDIETLGVSYRLLARADLNRSAVALATQFLFQKRSRLALVTPAANQMKALDTDTATGAALPIHPGAIDYFAREQLTFMDRYGDWLWLALFSMGGLSSAWAGAAQFFSRRRRELFDVLLDRLLKILEGARRAESVGALDELALELDRLVALSIKYTRNRRTNSRVMSALILGIDSARAAIADRRRDLLDDASGGAAQPADSVRPALAKRA